MLEAKDDTRSPCCRRNKYIQESSQNIQLMMLRQLKVAKHPTSKNKSTPIPNETGYSAPSGTVFQKFQPFV